jgi:Protein of unknown function (DUF2939)
MLRILFLLLAVFIGGWVAWPAFSAYQIYDGMKTSDEAVLQGKINWESMRASLRPAVTVEVEKAIGKAGGKGLSGVLTPQLKEQFMPQIIDLAMNVVVTPKGLAELMAHGGDVSKVVENIVSKQMGKLGGLEALTDGGSDSGGGGGLLGQLLSGDQKKEVGGLLGSLLGDKKMRKLLGKKSDQDEGGMNKSEPDMNAGPSDKPKYGLGNIKRFAYTGIGAVEFGVAKDQTADVSDVVAVMEFQELDWKLTGLVPRVK